ncbi:hypothetical protein BX616_004694 [Lobosporangium transversale]|nr:hypothetical protein BX616_004694 [Lobosporangium transversale]
MADRSPRPLSAQGVYLTTKQRKAEEGEGKNDKPRRGIATQKIPFDSRTTITINTNFANNSDSSTSSTSSNSPLSPIFSPTVHHLRSPSPAFRRGSVSGMEERRARPQSRCSSVRAKSPIPIEERPRWVGAWSSIAAGTRSESQYQSQNHPQYPRYPSNNSHLPPSTSTSSPSPKPQKRQPCIKSPKSGGGTAGGAGERGSNQSEHNSSSSSPTSPLRPFSPPPLRPKSGLSNYTKISITTNTSPKSQSDTPKAVLRKSKRYSHVSAKVDSGLRKSVQNVGQEQRQEQDHGQRSNDNNNDNNCNDANLADRPVVEGDTTEIPRPEPENEVVRVEVVESTNRSSLSSAPPPTPVASKDPPALIRRLFFGGMNNTSIMATKNTSENNGAKARSISGSSTSGRSRSNSESGSSINTSDSNHTEPDNSTTKPDEASATTTTPSVSSGSRNMFTSSLTTVSAFTVTANMDHRSSSNSTKSAGSSIFSNDEAQPSSVNDSVTASVSIITATSIIDTERMKQDYPTSTSSLDAGHASLRQMNASGSGSSKAAPSIRSVTSPTATSAQEAFLKIMEKQQKSSQQRSGLGGLFGGFLGSSKPRPRSYPSTGDPKAASTTTGAASDGRRGSTIGIVVEKSIAAITAKPSRDYMTSDNVSSISSEANARVDTSVAASTTMATTTSITTVAIADSATKAFTNTTDTISKQPVQMQNIEPSPTQQSSPTSSSKNFFRDLFRRSNNTPLILSTPATPSAPTARKLTSAPAPASIALTTSISAAAPIALMTSATASPVISQ